MDIISQYDKILCKKKEQKKSPRRVRFNLSPTDGVSDNIEVGGVFSVHREAGGGLKTRGTPPNTSDSSKHCTRSSRLKSGKQQHLAKEVHREVFKRFINQQQRKSYKYPTASINGKTYLNYLQANLCVGKLTKTKYQPKRSAFIPKKINFKTNLSLLDEIHVKIATADFGANAKSLGNNSFLRQFEDGSCSKDLFTENLESQIQYIQEKLEKIRLRPIISVDLSVSPGVRNRVYPSGTYTRGILSPTANTLPHVGLCLGENSLLRAARDGDDYILKDLLRKALYVGVPEEDVNAADQTGRTILSYIVSNGSAEVLEHILQLPNLNPNKADNEGNTPLHFAAQAGQIECLNCMLSRCKTVEIDARNNLGFTPLMKAALQGRSKCAKILLIAGANPTLRDHGRGFRADQWARYCGRYVCADVIEKHARQRLLQRSTSYGNWGAEHEIGSKVMMGKVVPVPSVPPPPQTLTSKIKKVFRTTIRHTQNEKEGSTARLVTQLTSAALCASSPVLPSAPSIPPVVKSLIRPMTVPRLQVTLVNCHGELLNNNNNNNIIIKPEEEYVSQKYITENEDKMGKSLTKEEESQIVRPPRNKKIK